MALYSLEEKPIARSRIAGSTGNKYIAAVKSADGSSVNATFRGKSIVAKPLSQTSSSNRTVINVCDAFDWTTTPFQNDGFKRELITRGEIKEYRLADDTVLKAILYSTSAISEGAVAAARNISSGIATVTSNVVGAAAGNAALNATTPIVNSIAQNVAEAVEAGSNLIKYVGDEFFKSFAPQTNANNAASDLNESWMQPYNGLYSLENTDFKYIFPYLNNKYKEIGDRFDDISFPPYTQTRQIAESVSKYGMFIAPGQYIERPQIFNMASSAEQSITFSFPLFNTQSYESAVNNYHFLWLFIYQNTPFRVTKSLVELPKIYEVNVPGVDYMRFSYVSNLSINFVGNKRHVNIPVPGKNLGLPSSINGIMPDAYDVQITFTSLTKRSSNMMLQMIKNSNVAF